HLDRRLHGDDLWPGRICARAGLHVHVPVAPPSGAIWDPEAYTVNYRDYRGEQRTSAKKAAELRLQGQPAGDCVDCGLCVTVCPIGIDIRNGPNFACINCGLCVDACDGVMSKLGRPRGLIDYE